jgi:hypothetical protein
MNYFTKKMLKERGWTDAGIAHFLGEADVSKPNPHYTNGSEMKLYECPRVESIEATDEYALYQRDVLERRKSGKRGAHSRKENLYAQLHTPEMSDEELDRLLKLENS